MGSRYRPGSYAHSIVLMMLFIPNVVRADVTGSIQGVVRDRTQGAIAGVHITVTNTQTNFKQEAISAADGSYRLLTLPAGTYKLNATGAGFQQFNATDVVVKVNDHGPGFNNTDFGLLKRTAIREKMAFEIRGEFFNIFNHAQFQNPSGNISNGSFGNVTKARDPRIGQVSAKFFW
jgi:hypothetical protein